MSDKPAYPVPPFPSGERSDGDSLTGITRRELFAAMAMQGFVSGPDERQIYQGEGAEMRLAQDAVLAADALIKELDK